MFIVKDHVVKLARQANHHMIGCKKLGMLYSVNDCKAARDAYMNVARTIDSEHTLRVLHVCNDFSKEYAGSITATGKLTKITVLNAAKKFMTARRIGSGTLKEDGSIRYPVYDEHEDWIGDVVRIAKTTED